ncbi:DHA2 family efflux MFS transporter permease subunit [Paenibacillus sp. HJL G12]|uniref:DHA2 family efflux MFS transporter permease subunit n=1 Tax=Paenibacillus dendrobii TaxID=2691084 RepID=A0A7X3IFM5_9BACL|nr:MDR family MFS transporter [Paenibacillus dendrobii]MWV43019.1 DHA2 family efflux MFS transporter permease subunit [Paenibacillus dendrobii]
MKQQQQSRLSLVIGALLLGILMASMDNSIVATAMGNIVGEIGGMDKFVWVTSAYMVAEMAGMPIFGKLSDMYGRKRFFIFGIIMFMMGSALCGTAQSITQLALYRAVQGIGGGALVPIAFTIMFDAVPLEKRGKLGGLFGAVFGISSIFGPLLGAYITDYIAWQWVFYINLPLGFVALFMIAAYYKESHERSKQPIDWAGAITLLGAVVCLMFALELGGKQLAWSSTPILSLFGGFVLLTAAFLYRETKAKEPIITFGLFKNRVYASSVVIGLFSGAAFIAASVYIPIFIQGVLGGSATNSGMVLLPMMLGSVVTATLSGNLMNRLSYRSIMISTLLLFMAGIILLSTLSPDSTRLEVTIYMILVGLGIGASFSVLGNACIHGLSYRQRGTASSTFNFLRSLGMTLGITVFGMIQNHAFSSRMSDLFSSGGPAPEALQMNDPHVLLSEQARSSIPTELLHHISEYLSGSITQTFAWALLPVIAACIATLFMGNSKLDSTAEQTEIAEEDEGTGEKRSLVEYSTVQ